MREYDTIMASLKYTPRLAQLYLQLLREIGVQVRRPRYLAPWGTHS